MAKFLAKALHALSLQLLTIFDRCTQTASCRHSCQSVLNWPAYAVAEQDDPIISAATPDHNLILWPAFKLLDADRDGYVTAAEMASFLAKLGLGDNTEAVEEEGRVDFEGFAAMYAGSCEREEAEAQAEEEEEAMAEAFALFDADGDGVISLQELQQLLLQLGFTECRDEAFCHLIIKSVDSHAEGGVDWSHFRRIISS